MFRIYVELLDEGTQVWRPVEAIFQGDDLFRIVGPAPPPNDENWGFPLGALVRCQQLSFQDGQVELVACERLD